MEAGKYSVLNNEVITKIVYSEEEALCLYKNKSG